MAAWELASGMLMAEIRRPCTLNGYEKTTEDTEDAETTETSLRPPCPP